ncbi:hypothetical protein WSK_2504 [Novosphingobium sp. Rr 2-17]|nr:hypothetical protein WSK_2504 [Novosphingobium sp. Rr 2-17]
MSCLEEPRLRWLRGELLGSAVQIEHTAKTHRAIAVGFGVIIMIGLANMPRH